MNEQRLVLAKRIADNIAYYRKKLNLTQLELAEKLNYSDKSVSKWERAEGVPDIFTLTDLASFFGVSIDTLLSERRKPLSIFKNKYIMAYFYASICLVIGMITFGILEFLNVDFDNWYFIIFSIVGATLTLLIFHLVWKRRIYIFVYSTLFIWMMALSVKLLLNNSNDYWVFIITAPIYFFIMFLLYILYKSRKNM